MSESSQEMIAATMTMGIRRRNTLRTKTRTTKTRKTNRKKARKPRYSAMACTLACGADALDALVEDGEAGDDDEQSCPGEQCIVVFDERDSFFEVRAEFV